MVEEQLRQRGIVDERVLEAMARVPRELFVPDRLRDRAYDDAALPIGGGQTISQPFMVARICEVLALHGSERVLDVGTGSGYQAAVLAELADEVHTIERLDSLAGHAREALASAGYAGVHVHVGDGSLGLPAHAPFAGDRRGGGRTRRARLALRAARAGRAPGRSPSGAEPDRSSSSSSAAPRAPPCCARWRAGSCRSSAPKASAAE